MGPYSGEASPVRKAQSWAPARVGRVGVEAQIHLCPNPGLPAPWLCGLPLPPCFLEPQRPRPYDGIAVPTLVRTPETHIQSSPMAKEEPERLGSNSSSTFHFMAVLSIFFHLLES